MIGREDPGTLIVESDIGVGDRIIAMNGTRIHTTLDISIAEMVRKDDAPWTISYRKPSGEIKETTIHPRKSKPRPMLGISYYEEDGRYVIQEVNQAADHGIDGFQKGDAVLSIEGIPFSEGRELLNSSARRTGKL